MVDIFVFYEQNIHTSMPPTAKGTSKNMFRTLETILF